MNTYLHILKFLTVVSELGTPLIMLLLEQRLQEDIPSITFLNETDPQQKGDLWTALHVFH